jgi:dTDP-glucose 4,6-dehydratase
MLNDNKCLVTGALGFIGSYFIKLILREYNANVVGLARSSNQKHLLRLGRDIKDPKFSLYYADFAKDSLSEVFEGITHVFHFGAKTFVNHSIRDPQPFIDSNVVGTYRLLEEARKSETLKKFFQVSTDEVYGAILNGSYKENSPLNPTNPYSATKAAADMLAVSYYNTYKVPIIITRTENNYGPYQHPQKVMPVFVKKALRNEPLPVYGDGKHSRMWLHVEDHCRAIIHLSKYGKAGEIYHVAGEQELTNLELAKTILRELRKPEDLIEFIPDEQIRPGHDRRYALNVDKLKNLGWKPIYDINRGIKEVLYWYVTHEDWFY